MVFPLQNNTQEWKITLTHVVINKYAPRKWTPVTLLVLVALSTSWALATALNNKKKKNHNYNNYNKNLGGKKTMTANSTLCYYKIQTDLGG